MKNLAKYPKELCRRVTALLLAFVVIAAGVFGTGVTVNAEGAGNLEERTFSYAYDVQRSPSYPKKGDTITASDLARPIRTGRDDRIDSYGSWTLTKIGTYSIIKNSDKDSLKLQDIVSTIASKYTGATEDNIVIHELKNGTNHIAYGVTLAYDSANGLAFFLGDPLSGGAGYLLSTGEQQSDPVYISANMDVTDWTAPKTYTITVANTENGTTTTSISKTIAGDVVTIHTSPNAGYAVSNVSVKDSDNAECTVSSTDGKYTFVMPAIDVTVTVTYAHTHTYDDDNYKTDGTYHWKECTDENCPNKAESVEGKVAHSSTGDHQATCQSKAVCDVCGVSYGSLAGHDYATTWNSNENGHWHVCQTAGCSATSSVSAHTPDHEGDATEEYAILCTKCRYEIEAKLAHKKGTHYGKIEATCERDGKVEYWDCANGCGKKLDKDGNVINTVTEEQLVIHRTGHALGTKHSAVEGNCVEPGTIEYYECANGCGTKLDANKNVLTSIEGTKSANNHKTALKKTDKIPATVETVGVKAYWTCESCHMSYADEAGKTVIGDDAALENWKTNASGGQIERAKAEIIEGANGKWTQDSKTPLAFRSNASFVNFLRVEVDGAVVTADNYDAEAGSIVVSLHADYLKTLSVGEHTLAIVSRLDSGETKASTTFTVVKNDTGTTDKNDSTNDTTKTETVKTGDNSRMTLWLLMMVIAFAVMVTVFVVNRKQRFYNRHTNKR